MIVSLRYSVGEFERESRYIDNLVWDALVVAPGDEMLFCGYDSGARWVQRATDAGAKVSVIEHRESAILEFAALQAQLVRGSTAMMPVRDRAYDLAIAFHYLHECDPLFHAQILSELARVANRVAIVEPGPPNDPLGKRVAALYSQAKRGLGQFEYYQPLAYWKRALGAVKADIAQHVFAFAKAPPLEYLRDTVALLLDTMEAQAAPRSHMDELRSIALRADSSLLPPPRYVVIGTAQGGQRQPVFTPREEPSPTPAIAQAYERKPVTVSAPRSTATEPAIPPGWQWEPPDPRKPRPIDPDP